MNLFKKYNTKDTLLVISLYPKKGELYSEGTSGVASYAKNVIKDMKRPVIVLSDYDKKVEGYEEAHTLVLRCFQPGSKTMWEDIFKKLRAFTNVTHVLIQFDFSIYGGMRTSAMIIPFLGILKLLGYQTSVVNHHVVTDIRKLKGHVGLKNNIIDDTKALIYNTIFHTFYFLLGMVSGTIIVLEHPLKKKMETMVRTARVTAIPHGVDTDLKAMSKAKARKKLGIAANEEVILFFGYVNWFKGADIFAKTYAGVKKLLGKKVRIIMAGGISPTLKDKEYYQLYFYYVHKTVYENSNMTLTGYIPQKDIAMYFAAADLVVFPYRHFMTASGVLSLVFSYQKPFIISHNIAEMLDSADFTDAMAKAHLTKKDITFSLSKAATLAKTEAVLKNGIKKKMVNMAALMAQKRSYAVTAELFEEAIFTTPHPAVWPIKLPAFLPARYTSLFSKTVSQ